MVRKDISRLRKHRLLHFQIGLCLSLLFSIVCLNWTVIEEKNDDSPVILDLDPMIDYEVVRTAHPKPKPPPPPKLSPVFEIIPDEKPPEIEFKLEEKKKIEVAPNVKIEPHKPTPPEPPLPPPVIKNEAGISDSFFPVIETIR